MNVIINSKLIFPREYPYIGIDSYGNNIVLFTQPQTGIALKHVTSRFTLKISSSWAEELFIPFTGQLTIKS